MKKIDSQALDVLNKALDMRGPGSPVTELADAIVDQVLSVNEIVRRSRTQAGTEGIYTALLRNIHTGGTSLTISVLPFNPGARGLAPYPSPMPAGFDVWLLSAAVTQLSGSGTISANLRVQVPPRVMGLSTTAAGVTLAQSVGIWNTIVAEGITVAFKSGQTEPVQNIGMRLPRDPLTEIIFSSTSSATATFDCFCMIGVFPVGLGQDVVV